ncbi:MAG TPA: prenyltransferase/squalene oxidase repeat-containing protein [Candidatus Acidoferrum sp.]|nr:prenyltransferase/squalene oxidase repeat-containing protein [Candidatus Acidoferrum sp.]
MRPALQFLLPLLCALTAFAADPATLIAPTPEKLEASIRRGVEFLLDDQNADGSWGSAEKTKELNIYAPVPGSHHAFRAAVTAMCVEALMETSEAGTNSRVTKALELGEAWLLENLPKVRRANSVAIYNVWTHAYGIQALAAMHERTSDTARRKLIKKTIVGQIDLLRRYESLDGGWGYYDFKHGTQRPTSDSTSFVTATVLLAFERAKKIGVEIPDDLVKRGVASLVRQQNKDFSYLYGEQMKYRPAMEINRPAGSLGRSQACNLALLAWGATNITQSVMTNWLNRFVSRNEWLGFARKRPVPHESWFMVAGYFFYYGHYYAALCTEHVPEVAAQKYHGQIAAILLPLQEKDGSWWDFPLYNYHQQYGTAFTLMTLVRCRTDHRPDRAKAKPALRD